jgi:2-polyprenyl-3-methyl-5-hydroxy-6-metoxy-1,4-benzoquinol methylase
VETGEFKKKSWRNLTFDLITAQQVLEHIHDPVAFLKLCNDRLYSDGWFVYRSFPQWSILGVMNIADLI